MTHRVRLIVFWLLLLGSLALPVRYVWLMVESGFVLTTKMWVSATFGIVGGVCTSVVFAIIIIKSLKSNKI